MFLNLNYVELIGYSGSVIVAVSLMMRSIHRLRWINLLGSATFSFYGILVRAYPVFLLNGFIALVDLYYLLQMKKTQDFFELFEIHPAQSPFLKRFLEFYAEDIKNFFPNFKLHLNENNRIIFTLRNLLPVGLMVAEPLSGHTLEIKLDYVIPNYRDLKGAHFLYRQERNQFKQQHISELITHSQVPKHTRYLQKIGFRKDMQRGQGWYRLKI